MQRINLWIIAAFLLAMLLSTVSQAQAQAGSLTRSAAMSGTVRDSASGLVARKSWVCALIPAGPSSFESRCAAVDTLGTYRLGNLPAGGMRVSVSCEAILGMGKGLAYDSVVFSDSAVLRRDWVVSTTGCDSRPVRRISGVFRGYYTPGFESSEFVPCPADAWFTPGDSLDSYPFDARRAWAIWPTRADRKVKWPDVSRDSYGNPRYYVRWRGMVIGPGHYGHMGVSAFELAVDTVFELRPPARHDCR